MANAIGDTTEPGRSEGDGTRTGAQIDVKTGARTKDDADEPEGVKSKIDITTPNKTNKTPILISY